MFSSRSRTREALGLESHGDLLGNRPHKGDQFPSDGDHYLIRIFPSGDEASIAFAQPYLRLPTAILNRLGELFQPELEMAAYLGRIAVGPGAFNQCPTRMGVARLGDAALTPTLPTGIC